MAMAAAGMGYQLTTGTGYQAGCTDASLTSMLLLSLCAAPCTPGHLSNPFGTQFESMPVGMACLSAPACNNLGSQVWQNSNQSLPPLWFCQVHILCFDQASTT
jgi:hypothetical protein